MRIFKTFCTLLLVLMASLMMGCEEETTVSPKVYSEKYYSLFTQIESSFEDSFYPEMADMMIVEHFDTMYAHEDILLFMDILIEDLDATLYELSLLGPQITDEVILKHQSKLEFALLDLMNLIKEYRSHETFDQLMPNQYTLYSAMYELFRDANPIFNKIYSNQLQIETHLKTLGFVNDDEYYKTKQENMYRYAYMYFVLGSQVSTYQSYSGLQVDPKYSNIITIASGDQYDVAELDADVMNTLTRQLSEHLNSINDYEKTFIISETVPNMTNILHEYLKLYDQYFAIRAMHPHDFFKKNMYMKYSSILEKRNAGNTSWWGKQNVIGIYSFDIEFEDTHHLVEMKSLYDDIFYLIYFENHHKNMFMLQ